MTSPSRDRAGIEREAERVQTLVRSRGEYSHIQVRAHRGHLVIESREDEEVRPVARLTPLGGGVFGLSFCRHDGRWERMPFSGTLEEVLDHLVQTLAAYLELMDFPDPTTGMRH